MSVQFDSGSKVSSAFLTEIKPTKQTASKNGPGRQQNQPFNDGGNPNSMPLIASGSQKHGSVRKRFSEFCYSAANVALIVATIIELVKLIQFIMDKTLYEFGEHVLSLAFYRQLIYVLVVVPLVFLVPIFNSISACFLWRSNALAATATSARRTTVHSNYNPTSEQEPRGQARRRERILDNQKSILVIKLGFELLLILLLFIALVFIGPNISSSSLTSQIELEIRKHMKHRYVNDFSMPFLDALQQEYECCDELWYRANLADSLPLSCYKPNTNYSLIYGETCPEVLGSLISARCAIIAACLLISLISLAVLLAIDILSLLTLRVARTGRNGRQQYEFVASDARQANSKAGALIISPGESDDDKDGDVQSTQKRTIFDDEELLKPSEVVSRLKLNERDRQELMSGSPVLEFNSRHVDRSAAASRARASSELQPAVGHPLEEHRASPTILTRANFVTVRRERSQSPAFVDSLEDGENKDKEEHQEELSGATQRETPQQQRPIKGVLKKTSSFQRIDNEEEEEEVTIGQSKRWSSDEDEEQESLKLDYAERLRQSTASSLLRQQQTRRSLLNVRFADC